MPTTTDPTAKDITVCKAAFLELCAGLMEAGFCNPIDAETIETEWQAILASHSEPHRKYHNLRHIASMIGMIETELFDDASKDEAMELPDRLRLLAFALYHDFYYETFPLDLFAQNEARSAARMTEFFDKIGVIEGFTAHCADLILASKTHKLDAVSDPYGALALDYDMSILATEAKLYDDYAKGIRAEFSAFADADFYPARLKRFLEPTIAGGRIFMTDDMHKRFNDAAIGNLRREAAQISLRLKP